MASELLMKLGTETIERLIRIESEQAINAGIVAGEDQNAITKRVWRALFGDGSKLVEAAKKIPGLKYAPHLILTTAAEVLSRSADKFLPGDQRPMVRMVRLALKVSAPALIGIGEAATDVIERQINTTVDRTVSPAGAAAPDRNKTVDLIAVIEHPLFGAPHPFFPVARDEQGNVRKTDWGHPLVLDLTYQKFVTDYEQRNPHKDEKREGVGLVRLYTVAEWAQMIQTSDVQVEAAKLEEIKRLFAPAKAGEWSDKTWDVIRASMRSSARFQRESKLDWLDHEESEGLIQSLLKGKPDPKIVNELLGEGFHSRIGQGAPEGEFSFDVLVEIEAQAMDKWLGGEQPLYTKVVRAVRRIRRSATFHGVSWMWVVVPIAMASSVIWLPIIVGAILLVVALNMYMDGLSGTDGTILLNNGDAVRLMLYSGGLVFFVTTMFPFMQTMLSWIRHLFPRVKEDWLVDTGRKVSGFTLTLVSVTAIAIILNVPPNVREFIPLMFLGTVGVGFILISANARSEAERSAIRGAKILGVAFALFLVVGVFVWGSYLGNADSVEIAESTTTSAFTDFKSYITSSRWLQLAFVFTALLVSSVLRSMFEYRKVPDGVHARLRIRGAGILTVAIAASLIAHVFNLPSKIQSESPRSSPPAVRTTTVTPVPATTPAVKQRKLSSLCDDKEISFHQRQELGCKD